VTRILVTGAAGQIGSELVPALRQRYGREEVLATDIRRPEGAGSPLTDGPFELLDATDGAAFAAAVARHRAGTVYHLVAILSAKGEAKPQRAYEINMGCLLNALEVARQAGCSLFVPSSIAAFGPTTPPDPAPQDTVQRPTSMYGITKVAGELLCDYYHRRWGVDTRGLRYPGLISWAGEPGGGTTDYAVEIFHQAVTEGRYTCFLAPDTRLDMMYMPDAIRAAVELMEADPEHLAHRNAYNLAAVQLTPATLAGAIRHHLPGFAIDYDVDPVRQAIAESWPRRVDDAAARSEWGWQPRWDLEAMTADMIAHLTARTAGTA
jgi:nucleoside-diphosphate-sugar epimerase